MEAQDYVFNEEDSVLSPRYPSPMVITLLGRDWEMPTIEQAYHAHRIYVANEHDSRFIPFLEKLSQAQNSDEVHEIAHTLRISYDSWLRKRQSVMTNVLQLKFPQEAKSTQMLLDTGTVPLVFSPTAYEDLFWGQSGNEGKNLYGKALMKIRHQRQVQRLVAAAWAMQVEQQHGGEGWTMSKACFAQELEEAFQPFRDSVSSDTYSFEKVLDSTSTFFE